MLFARPPPESLSSESGKVGKDHPPGSGAMDGRLSPRFLSSDHRIIVGFSKRGANLRDATNATDFLRVWVLHGLTQFDHSKAE